MPQVAVTAKQVLPSFLEVNDLLIELFLPIFSDSCPPLGTRLYETRVSGSPRGFCCRSNELRQILVLKFSSPSLVKAQGLRAWRETKPRHMKPLLPNSHSPRATAKRNPGSWQLCPCQLPFQPNTQQRLKTKDDSFSGHPFPVLQLGLYTLFLLSLLLALLRAKKPSSRPDVGITLQMPKSL